MSKHSPENRRSEGHGKHALRFGTEAHYLDALYYDQTYRRRKSDVRFYADLAGSRGGPVLELGAGTGRVSIAIARKGMAVVAVDRMPEMLKRAQDRIAKLPKAVQGRIELHRGDLQRINLERRFPLIIAPFNVFMHLYDRRDWERSLATVRKHLRPRGRLAFDVLLPDPFELARDPRKTYRSRPVKLPGRPERYRYGETFDYDPVSQIQMVTMIFENEEDPTDFFITPLAHRHIYPAELEALLHYNGFAIEERYGDFDGSPLGPHSESQIIVARPVPLRSRSLR